MSPNENSGRTRRVAIALVVISAVAIGISAYLASVALTSSKVAGCGGGNIFDCDDVINSRWSRWLGIPVSLLALALYVGLFGSTVRLLFLSRKTAKDLSAVWSVITILVFSAGFAAIWFTSLQVFVLEHLCSWCLAAHACGLAATVLLVWQRPLPGGLLCRRALVSIAGIGVLVAGQLAFRPVTYELIEYDSVPASPATSSESDAEVFEFTPDMVTPPVGDGSATAGKTQIDSLSHRIGIKGVRNWIASPSLLLFGQVSQTQPATGGTAIEGPPKARARRLISMSGGTLKLDIAQWPLWGATDADFVFVEMFDYTCDHCRRTHRTILAVKEQLGGALAVVALPVPLNRNCNSTVQVTSPRMAESCELGKLAVAVWRVAPEKFSEFHDYLMGSPAVPRFAEAKAKAVEIIEDDRTSTKKRERLEAELASAIPGQYIAQHVELYKRVGAGNVPKLLFPATTVVGEFTSVDGLLKIIREQLPPSRTE